MTCLPKLHMNWKIKGKGKSPKVKIATLHPVMGKILVCIALCVCIVTSRKKMLFTDAGEIEHVYLAA